MSKAYKKLSYKYRYLKLELEELEEILEKFTKSFNSIFGKYFVDKNSEVWINEETGEIRKDPPGVEKETPSKNPAPKKIKQLYKTLSTKTHPDKGGSAEEFNNIKSAYQEQDLMLLLMYASDYGIDFELDDDDEILLLNSIDNCQIKIKNHQSSLAYNFFNGPKEKRLGVIGEIQRLYNLEFSQEEIQNFLSIQE